MFVLAISLLLVIAVLPLATTATAAVAIDFTELADGLPGEDAYEHDRHRKEEDSARGEG